MTHDFAQQHSIFRGSCWRNIQAALAFIAVLCHTCVGAEEVEEYGRLHWLHPVSHCCMGEACISNGTTNKRHAVVTTLRSPDYMMGLRELQCTLERTNPGLQLVILGAAGDFEPDDPIVDEIKQLGEYRLEEDLRFPNALEERFSLNWIKLRLWRWEEYDALIILDVDVLVLGDLTHLFNLAANFAWTRNNGPYGWDLNKGGLIMMRPCKKTYDAMMRIIAESPQLQFVKSYAEQDFLSWYFRYTAIDLPTRYNLNFRWLNMDGRGPGGAEPVLIHFADPDSKERLFNATQADPLWSAYLCYQPQHPELDTARAQYARPEHVELQRSELSALQEQHVRVHSTPRSAHLPDRHRHARPAQHMQE